MESELKARTLSIGENTSGAPVGPAAKSDKPVSVGAGDERQALPTIILTGDDAVDRYKKLLSNTVIFAIGTFSSKFLTFFLTRLYTAVLNQAEYGTVDLIQQSGNLLIPLATLGITNAVIRFGLDRGVRKSDVFTTGLLAILGGFAVLAACIPLMNQIDFLTGHVVLLCFFVLTSSLRSLCSQFVRAKGAVKLFALDGILSTITTIAFNVLYLVVLRLGIFGYIFSLICSDMLSVIFLTYMSRLYRYIKFKGLDFNISKSMLKYSVPLIPNTVLWWITNVSNRYIITHFLGEDMNGMYAAAYKIPSIIMLVSGIFMDAWQISAVTEQKARNRFYTKVVSMYAMLLFFLASGVILFTKVVPHVLFAKSYYDAWRYIPLLVMSIVFTCLVNFLGSIYMVEKKSIRSLMTAALSAVINVVLNLWWIPKYGVNGAAMATLVCYLVVFVVRMIDTRKYVRIRWNYFRLIASTVILAAQSAIMLLEVPYWVLYEILLFAAIVALDGKGLILGVQKLLGRSKTPH